MPAIRQIALNNNAGAFVDILASIAPTLLEMMEDESVATQGIQVKTLLDNFATTNVFSFNSEPVTIPNQYHSAARVGKLLGLPAQNTVGGFNYTAATKLVSARSNGAAGTTLRFTENE